MHTRVVRHRSLSRDTSKHSKRSDEDYRTDDIRAVTKERVFKERGHTDGKVKGGSESNVTISRKDKYVKEEMEADAVPENRDEDYHGDGWNGFPSPRPYEKKDDFYEPKRNGKETNVPTLPDIIEYGPKVASYHSTDVLEQLQKKGDEERDKWHEQMADMVESNTKCITKRLEVHTQNDERNTFVTRQQENPE